jgi:beta-lactamase regulating signal transducer with metallopeptidase domain/predicted  nucleic acid-binding Zn-ribbon protein
MSVWPIPPLLSGSSEPLVMLDLVSPPARPWADPERDLENPYDRGLAAAAPLGKLETAMPAEPQEPRAAATPSRLPEPKAAPRRPQLHEPRAAAVPPEPRTPSSAAGGAWRQWMVQLGVIREAAMSLPPIPARVWMVGIAALLLVTVLRIAGARRVVRVGRAAPPSVERMVAEVSRDLGLRRAPVTLMVDLPVTPLLWCGRHVRLVLPRSLWAQLDDLGRRAVICHELAHLRRRDHWVCRAELIIGWVYWWNPVVWWVRRRLREEADLSCDAWVTALMPNDRRAYAQALLQTRRCTNLDLPAVSSVGLGATTIRARRFARRLTMVMTAQNSPRISRKGMVLAGVLALGAVLVTPIWACPEKEKDPCATSKSAKAPKADKKKMTLVVPAHPPKAPKPPKAPPAGTTFERYMMGQEYGDDSLEQRMKELEHKLQQLHKELQKIMQDLPQARRGYSQVPMASDAPKVKRRAVPPIAVGGGTGIGSGKSGSCLRGGAPCTSEVVVRTYKLPEGKLGALTELMIRDDVPIRVRPGSTEIEVHGTAAEHCIFDAFCTMIGGEDRVKGYRMSEGTLKAMSELMIRSDVPILVEPGKEGIKVHGTDLEQMVFAAFVKMIDGGGRPRAQTTSGEAAHAYAKALADLAHQYESNAAAQMAELDGLRAAYRSLAQQARAIERQAQRMEEQADKLFDKADQLEDKADEAFDRAEDTEGDKRHELLAKAEALMHKAEALRHEAEAIEAQAEALEAEAENLEDEAETIEDQIEDIEELAEDMED